MKYHVEMTHNEQRLGNVIKRLQNELAEAECQLDELAKVLEAVEWHGQPSRPARARLRRVRSVAA